MRLPPSMPFLSPKGSEMLTRVVTVNMGGFWRRYLNNDGTCRPDDNDDGGGGGACTESTAAAGGNATTVTMRGY